MKLNILNRKVHYWAAIVVAIPLLVVIITGILLQLKKDVAWIQPPSQKGTGKVPVIGFATILEQAKTVKEAEIESWADIERIDVRPSKGILKVRAQNNWELQLDSKTGEIKQVAFRRSDIIEAIHDGSWFHEAAKLWLFLPAALVLLLMWITGIYLFWLPIVVKRRKRKRRAETASVATIGES